MQVAVTSPQNAGMVSEIAACLEETTASEPSAAALPAVDGTLYCFLPLPFTATGLPLHVHASWALQSNRRELWSNIDDARKLVRCSVSCRCLCCFEKKRVLCEASCVIRFDKARKLLQHAVKGRLLSCDKSTAGRSAVVFSFSSPSLKQAAMTGIRRACAGSSQHQPAEALHIASVGSAPASPDPGAQTPGHQQRLQVRLYPSRIFDS